MKSKTNELYHNNNINNLMTMVDNDTILPVMNNNINDIQNINYLNTNNNNNSTQNILNKSYEIVAAATRNTRNNKKHNEKPYERKEVRFNLKDNPTPIQTVAMNHNNNNQNNMKTNINNSINIVNHNKDISMDDNDRNSEVINNNTNELTNEGDDNNYDENEDFDNIDNENKNSSNSIHNNQLTEQPIMESTDDVIMVDDIEKDEGETDPDIIVPNSVESPMSKVSNGKDKTSVQENNKTEKLKHLDPSFIAEKNIKNVKRRNKEERIKDIKNKINETNANDKKNENSIKQTERHIKLMETFGEYCIQDLIKEIASTDVITKLVYLLDLFPKFRTEFLRALKLTPKQIITNVMTIISKHKIIKVRGKVEGKDCEIFLDTCASVNVITRTALNKLKINKPSVGRISETIFQAYSNSSIDSDIYNLEISIGSRIFNEYFRVIEKDDIFDILIGVDSLKNNRFDINLVDDILYYIDENNKYIKLTDLLYDINFNHTSSEDEEYPVSNSEPLLVTITFNNDQENNTADESINLKGKLINDIISSVPKKVRNEIGKLFIKFKNVIAIKTDDLGKSKLLPHRIELLPNTSPIKLKAYRLSKSQMVALKKILIKLKNNKLIVPSNSTWSFPVVLVPKKNNDWRMCVDYRQLNNVTIKDSYALPLIDEIFMFIGKNAKVLSTIDLFSGYHQVPMYIDDQDKTTFTTMFGNYKFRVMPFGLCNAPASFQREMNRIFFDLIGVCLFIYIDDLIVFSDSVESHIDHLTKVFSILEENGLKLNLEKCSFFKEEVILLGHTLSTKGISPIPDKVKVICNWIPPKNTTQLKSFLGAVGYYRKFIRNFAQIASPLFALLKKDVSYFWSDSCNSAFENLKYALTRAPILTPPDYSKPFIIRTDASKDGLGGVLLQINEDKLEVPIYFESRSLSPSESNYSVTDLEGKAVYHCVKKFKPYFSVSKFPTIVYTDHKPLVSIFSKREPSNSRHLKWITELSILKVSVQFEEGRKNVIADALSRIPTNKINDNKEILNAILNNNISNNKSNNENNEDNINKFMEDFINKRIINIDGVDYYKQGENIRKIIKDRSKQIELINEAHQVGHEGIYKTYNRLKRDYYWKSMKKDVQTFIRNCHRCQIYRPQILNKNVESIATPPGYPFSRVGLDLIGPLPTTKNNNKYIIVLVDYLTKWVEAEPLKTIESDDVIKFLKMVFSRHGVPEILITDNGPQFFSDKTKAFLDLHDVFVHYSTTYHPATNGEVENRNREISKYLRLLGEKVESWDETLYSALWALRTAKNEVTKFSSFELLYGRRDLQPFELTLNIEKRNDMESEEEYWLRKFITHDKWIKEAISNIETANKLWEDRRKQIKRMRACYKAGDLVLVKVFNRRKLDPYFTGPLRIAKQELNTVTVCDPITGEIADRNIHLKNVVPYFTEINLYEEGQENES